MTVDVSSGAVGAAASNEFGGTKRSIKSALSRRHGRGRYLLSFAKELVFDFAFLLDDRRWHDKVFVLVGVPGLPLGLCIWLQHGRAVAAIDITHRARPLLIRSQCSISCQTQRECLRRRAPRLLPLLRTPW